MAKIFVDLDSVLTNFDKAIDNIGASKKEGAQFWAAINKAGKEFWSTMEWMPDGKELWKAVEIYKPTILTAPTRHKDSIEGKKEWLYKNLPEVPYLIDQDKAAHAGKNKILIDDREKNIKKWEEAGGIGILHKDAKTTIDKLNKALGSIEKTAMAESTPKTPPKVPWYPKDVRGGRPEKIVVPKKGPGSFKREKDWRKGVVAMDIVTEKLDSLANTLESKGLVKQAAGIDVISNTLEVDSSDDIRDVMADVTVDGSENFGEIEGAQELIAASDYYLEDAMQQVEAADMEIEAAKKKKKKWIKGINLEKGRLGKYKKKGESMAQAAARALRSDDPSVRGMGSFYVAMHGKKEEMEAESCQKDAGMETEARVLPKKKDRPAPVFPKESPKVKDDKDHFPIPDAAHGRNALARVNQYGEVPSWYDGSLSDLKDAVVKAVKGKFPDIEVEEEKFEPEE